MYMLKLILHMYVLIWNMHPAFGPLIKLVLQNFYEKVQKIITWSLFIRYNIVCVPCLDRLEI